MKQNNNADAIDSFKNYLSIAPSGTYSEQSKDNLNKLQPPPVAQDAGQAAPSGTDAGAQTQSMKQAGQSGNAQTGTSPGDNSVGNSNGLPPQAPPIQQATPGSVH